MRLDTDKKGWPPTSHPLDASASVRQASGVTRCSVSGRGRSSRSERKGIWSGSHALIHGQVPSRSAGSAPLAQPQLQLPSCCKSTLPANAPEIPANGMNRSAIQKSSITARLTIAGSATGRLTIKIRFTAVKSSFPRRFIGNYRRARLVENDRVEAHETGVRAFWCTGDSEVLDFSSK